MNRLREELSEEKRKEYDELTTKMMREVEEELAKLPERRKGQLDGPRDKVYRDISIKYLPEIRRILGTVKKQKAQSDLETADMVNEQSKIVKTMRNAIKNGNLDVVKELLENNDGLLKANTVFGSWLHIAASYGRIDIASYLIDCGIDVNRDGDISGGNPIRSAAENGQIEMVELYTNHGTIFDVSEAAKNPLFGAISGGHYSVVRFLVEHGIDIATYYAILKFIETGRKYGEVAMLVNAAGVSPSQASVETILKVDLYGTAVLLEEVGKIMKEGGVGVTISSQSGHRMPQLTVEEDELLACTPTEELLSLAMLQPENIKDTLHAYQLAKRCNEKRVMYEAVKWGEREQESIPFLRELSSRRWQLTSLTECGENSIKICLQNVLQADREQPTKWQT